MHLKPIKRKPGHGREYKTKRFRGGNSFQENL